MEGSLLPNPVLVQVFSYLPFQRFLQSRHVCKRWYRLSLVCHGQWARYIRRYSKAKILQTVPLYEQAYRIYHKKLRRQLYYDIEQFEILQNVHRARANHFLQRFQHTMDLFERYVEEEALLRQELTTIHFPLATLENPRPCKRRRAVRADLLLEESLGGGEPTEASSGEPC